MIDSSGSLFGTGGMLSKILVAKKALDLHITINIMDGKRDKILENLFHNEKDTGTEFSK